jgi:spore maturation protein CgeB
VYKGLCSADARQLHQAINAWARGRGRRRLAEGRCAPKIIRLTSTESVGGSQKAHPVPVYSTGQVSEASERDLAASSSSPIMSEPPFHQLRILYVAMQYDYGVPARGESFEDANFKSSLVGMGHEITHFDFMARTQAVGKRAMRRELIAVAGSADFDLVFCFLFTNEIDPRTVDEVRRVAGVPVINWFADDHWRFSGFTSRFGHHFDLNVTTDADSLPKYAQAGISQVMLSQWACNRYRYHPASIEEQYGTTFVGQPHGDRRMVIESVTAAGVPVQTWGSGWPSGRLSTEEMIAVFGTSAINLNLANSSRPSTLETIVRRLARIGGSFGERPPQIKGRTFEIPGCRGFQLSENVPHLGQYFEIGREISVFETTEDLIEQVRYWSSHTEQRREVAKAGYERVMREHTYDHRFEAIFTRLGIA